MKRVLIFLLSVLLTMGMPLSVRAQEQDPSSPVEADSLRERMAAVMEQYPEGSYFTDNGLPCTHHYECREIGNCNCKVVTRAEAGTAGNMQCYGFARLVFYQLFHVPYPRSNTVNRWQAGQGPERQNVAEIWSMAPDPSYTEESVKARLMQCQFGDVIQTGLPHSMVVLSVEADGVRVYDANFDMRTCGVDVHTVSWSHLIRDCRNYGSSLYRYAPNVTKGSLECVYRPMGGLIADGSNPEGLGFRYTQGEYSCLLICEEGGVFVCDDGINRVVLSDPEEFGLKLSVEQGDRYDTGTLRFSYWDAVWESTEEVLGPSQVILDLAFPVKQEYTVGEPLSVEGAYLYLAHPEKGRVFCFADDLTFRGFSSQEEGELTVTMGAYGYEASYTVRIRPSEVISPSGALPSGTPAPTVGTIPFVQGSFWWVLPLVALPIVLAVSTWFIKKKSKQTVQGEFFVGFSESEPAQEGDLLRDESALLSCEKEEGEKQGEEESGKQGEELSSQKAQDGKKEPESPVGALPSKKSSGGQKNKSRKSNKKKKRKGKK